MSAHWTTIHRQVDTSRGIKVDSGISELLETLWAAGMDTEFSCEGGQAYIKFANEDDATRFHARCSGHRQGCFVYFPNRFIDLLAKVDW